ncbi:chitinase [Chitinivorax tropicus]|uniref:chitinase n=1 Tax=Chitinivorax tropicus TaxID=714531 RepID=A0A840MJ66_9PROT|nr:glycosyl hydrolase family 18 protein [Chitinivorax tropicus]MBB5017229.1 chitinase [Chitinivorax tropicus]
MKRTLKAIALAATLTQCAMAVNTAYAADSYKIVGYFTQWGIYARNFQPSDIPVEKLTHLNYAFINISSDGQCITGDNFADLDKGYPGDKWDGSQPFRGNFNQLNKLKQQHPHLKTLMSIGGWTWSKYFSDVAATEAARTKFAKSCVAFAAKYGFDGVDIDWEYPVGGGLPDNSYRPEDKHNYTLLMQALRAELNAQGGIDGKKYLLTAALGAGHDKIANLEVPQFMATVDFANVMTYDFHGGWEKVSNHHAPLYRSSRDPSPGPLRDNYNVDAAINNLLKAGAPASKLVMGIPFYGRGWTATSSDNHGLFQATAANPPQGTWENGVYDYWDLLNKLNSGFQRYWDAEAQVPWMYNPSTGMVISYEDQQSLKIKTDYIKSKKLGGGMFWDMSGDVKGAGNTSLLKTLAAELGVNGTPTPTPTPTPGGDVIPAGQYNLVNGAKCLTAASAANGAKVNAAACNGKNTQQFDISSTGTAVYKVTNVAGSKSLDVSGRKKTPGTPVTLWAFNGGQHQQFTFKKNGNAYTIRAAHSNLCLENTGAGLVQSTCSGSASQAFELRTAGTPTPTPTPKPTCSGDNWDASKSYTQGQRVAHQGKLYEAKWWTKGENPAQGGDWSAWKVVGNC